MLQVRNLVRFFHQTRVLDDLSFDIVRGEIAGLMGPSGGGKSTLLRCLQGLDQPDSGQIRCQGRTGLMFQDFQLFPHMSVLDNAIYMPRRVLGVPEDEARQQASRLLESLRLADRAYALPHQLSGGQKQRAALVRALMAKPDLLMCDEPSSALDAGSVDDMVALFRQVAAMGVTLLLSSHDQTFLLKLCTRILGLQKGRWGADIQAGPNGFSEDDQRTLASLFRDQPA
jgi:polar amino acid transport system ATP-binding protein